MGFKNRHGTEKKGEKKPITFSVVCDLLRKEENLVAVCLKMRQKMRHIPPRERNEKKGN